MAAVGSNQLDINGDLYNISQIFYNGTIFNTTSCTPSTCSLLLGTFHYLPNLAGNIFFTIAFSLLLIAHLALGTYYRTWGVTISMVLGFLLEIAAYISRILIHNDDFARIYFLIYIYCISIGPTLFSAAIYLCLARIVVVYGEDSSRWRPRTYSVAFVAGDIFSLMVQATGGGMAIAPDYQNVGLDVLIAGLGCQVLSLTVFAVACADFSWRVHRGKGNLNPEFDTLRQSRRWKGFLFALATATIAIYIRSVYRIVELQAGFQSDFANQEGLFMALEGTVITIATLALTIFHPGLVFRRQWDDADFSLKGRRVAREPARSKGMAT